MSRKQLDTTLDFLKTIDGAHNPMDVCRKLRPLLDRLGIAHFMAGTIPYPGASKTQQLSNVLVDFWPGEWTARYFSKNYIMQDPAIRQLTTSTGEFSWSELDPLCRSDLTARRIMAEAAEFRLRQGITIPLLTIEGDIAGFSFAGERLEMSPEDRGMLRLVATYAFGRLLVIRETPGTGVSLAPREKEALQWASEGKSEWEIGMIMGISEHGAEKHLRSARAKLGVSSRVHAVAQGIRLGLIV
jgi:LuxR family quorum sensing-dependent transcriptional regulator